jgi:anhydro-N-acetylmuramic acid kinase
MRNSIGLMSGTSMDGIDAALIQTDGEYQIQSKAHLHFPYSSQARILFKILEFATQEARGDLILATQMLPEIFTDYLHHQLNFSSQQIEALCLPEYLQYELNDAEKDISFKRVVQLSTILHTKAVFALKKKSNATAIDCIGYHGQTVYHSPQNKKTVQLGFAEDLASSTQTTVVYDFRSQDIALGGQGAPLAPIYHQALAVRDQYIPVCVINCGGIANVTLILSSALNDLIGFDAGPGNCLLDSYLRYITQGLEQMDKDGLHAFSGTVHVPTLTSLIDTQYHPSLQALDTNHFILSENLKRLSCADACATLSQFTVECIVRSLQQQPQLPKHYVLCGGGASNPYIRQKLSEALKNKIHSDSFLQTANEVGWGNQAIEAELMAYLAVRNLKKLPISLPKTTGVPYPISGGQVAYPSHQIETS